MTQIINLIIFLKELLFGNDRVGPNNGGRDRRKRSFKSLFMLVIFMTSLGLNYYTVKGLYQSTTNNIRLKEQLRELVPLQERVTELELMNDLLTITLTMTAPEKYAAVVSNVKKLQPPGVKKKIPNKNKTPAKSN